jgi:hypothetical protein
LRMEEDFAASGSLAMGADFAASENFIEPRV